MRTLSIALLVLCCAARAETPRDQVLLYDHGARERKSLVGPCLADRLYVRYSSLEKWDFVQCQQGAFATPTEIILEGTVVSGALIGADASDRFELTREGQWVKSLRKERWELLVLARVPVVRTITSFTLDNEGKLPLAGAPASVASAPPRRR